MYNVSDAVKAKLLKVDRSYGNHQNVFLHLFILLSTDTMTSDRKTALFFGFVREINSTGVLDRKQVFQKYRPQKQMSRETDNVQSLFSGQLFKKKKSYIKVNYFIE